jgi:hypothetical protein
MATAALIVSILAIVIATASAWYTRRQAISTEGVERTEAARRHDELQPVLVGAYVYAEDTREGQRPGVKLNAAGQKPWVVIVSVEFPGSPQVL